MARNGQRLPARRKPNSEHQRQFSLVVERDADGWYIGSVPELPGCHTQARSLDVLQKRVREAILLYLEASDVATGSEFVGIQRITVSA